ncbi:MAG: serine/threonine protein kinase [Polyangiaceae bacterium]|nr:serine/threonine protein kinase [Polyangiaceae bacterium]
MPGTLRPAAPGPGAGDTHWLGRLVASRYRLIARLGESRLAEVYLARHVLIDRLSAIKVLRTEVGGDRGLRSLFLREAKAVNRINHPNIVEITDYGETEETAFLVMEYVPGEALSRTLSRGPLGWERAAHIGLRLGLALSRAHEMGVVHRDLKPSYVLVVEQRGGDDIIKLTDFGVAKLLSGAGPQLVGTTGLLAAQLSPGYVAPELQSKGTLDARSDLFSLGVIIYQCACGALPYDADEPLPARQPALRRIADVMPDVPPTFDLALGRLLAWDPEERPRDAFEVVALFREVLEPREEPVEQDPPTVRRMPPRRHGPKLLSMPFDQIVPLCQRAWDVVRDRAELEVRPGLGDDLRQTSELMTMIERLGATVSADTRALATVEERGRIVRAEIGARIDEHARTRSRALGWAGSLAEHADRVRSQRLSGSHRVSTVDALLWEEATLDHGEEVTRARAADLGDQIDELQTQLSLANEALERDRSVLAAQLEGHVAALRALASEAWAALDELGISLGVELPTEPS